jgi:uncharacterized damage-inducible protein DinB
VRTEVQKIINTLKHTFEKGAWHGPAVQEALAGISEDAIHTRVGNSHTVLELVAHMAAWRNYVTEKLNGNDSYELTDEQNFPKVKNWETALADLNKSQADLINALEKTSDEKLQEIVPGRKFKFYVMLHGIIHHDLYHTGQIVLLKKQPK